MKARVKTNTWIQNWLMIFGILLTAWFWRFWNFSSRIVLNQDQTRDVIIATYAQEQSVIPPIGSPSSAGPFNFGPWYQWLIMGWQILLPGWWVGPWIGFGIMMFLSVIMLADTGRLIGGKWGLLTFGLLAAFSSGMVENSGDMLNTVIVLFSSSLSWWAIIKWYTTKGWWWLLLSGFGVGLSINFHFQSMGLLVLMAAAVIVNKEMLTERIKIAFGLGAGLIGAFVPLIIFDIQRGGVWIKSVIWYYTVGVKKFYVPVRWLTEIRDFWPGLFGEVIGGEKWVGYMIVVLGIAALIIAFKKKLIDQKVVLILATLLGQIILMRFYKGTRSREYMIVFQPLIVMVVGWIILTIGKVNKWFLVGGLTLFLTVACVNNWEIINRKTQVEKIFQIKSEIDRYFGEDMRAIVSDNHSEMIAMPLFMLYQKEWKIYEGGARVRVCDGDWNKCEGKKLITKFDNYYVFEDEGVLNPITAEKIYFDTLFVNYGQD